MSQSSSRQQTQKAPRRLRDSFLVHLLLILALIAVSYVLFFVSLSWITRHGEDAKVPNVTGKDIRLATSLLEKEGFSLEIDSAYDSKKKPMAVLVQSPEPNAVVKQGRTIFLTVNKSVPPNTSMPNLVGFTLRSAMLVLQSNKLVLGDTTFRPDISKGAVLEQLYNGKPVAIGAMIPQGSRIDLVIGSGLGDLEINVPDVAGLSYAEATNTLTEAGLNFVPVFEGAVSDTGSAVVYMQLPNAINELGIPSRVRQGDFIDLIIRQSPDMLEVDSIKNAWKKMRPVQEPSRPLKPIEDHTQEPEPRTPSPAPRPAPMGPPKPGATNPPPARPQAQPPARTNGQQPTPARPGQSRPPAKGNAGGR